MTYALLSLTQPKARKRHVCIWCGNHIQIWERYEREKSVYDGRIQNFAWHLECRKDQQDGLATGDDPEFLPHSNERPNIKAKS